MPKALPDTDALPTVCEQCFGNQKNVRIVRDSLGAKCQLCAKPYTTYRWKVKGQTRQTLICQSCSRSRGACQHCMNDVKYGLTLSIRDAALKMAHKLGKPGPQVLETLARKMNTRAHPEQLPPMALTKLRDVLTSLPLQTGYPLRQRPADATKLFIAGIEPGTDIGRLRASLGGAMSSMDLKEPMWYAIAEFSGPEEAQKAADRATETVDGTRLKLLWYPSQGSSSPLAIDPTLYPKVALAMRKFVKGTLKLEKR